MYAENKEGTSVPKKHVPKKKRRKPIIPDSPTFPDPTNRPEPADLPTPFKKKR